MIYFIYTIDFNLFALYNYSIENFIKGAILMNKKRYFGDLMLFLAAFIWGTAFVAQVTGMDKIGPFTFNMARSIIAIICLGAYLIITKAKLPKDIGILLQGGLVCGFFIFMGTSLQQIGLQYTTAGKTGFITSFYILIIPFLTMFFLKHKIDLLTWISIVIGFIGLYLLAIPSLSDFSINKGDFYSFSRFILLGRTYFNHRLLF